VSRANEILAALAALRPVGPSEGGAGLQLAYRVAIANFVRNGANRVLFCTDGAFNPGTASERELLALIDEKTRTGIALTVLGFGGANDHSTPLERLVQKAGVTYGYVDSGREAERQLVENVCRSIATIARDVRVQVDFNPAKVLAYRLIGYENRPLRREDYSDDAPVTGEVGAGQALTALYEIVPTLPQDLEAAAAAEAARVHYSASGAVSSRLELPDAPKPPGNELLTVSVRYKNPNTFFGWPRAQEFALADAGTAFADASADFRFAAAVAEFGMMLRGSPHRGASSLRDVAAWANSAAGPAHDAHGYRRDFVALARKAGSLFR
jgi:Ca-activated chloride channel family protein